MKKLLFAVTALALVASGFAADAKKQMTPEERAAAKEKVLRKTGGIVTRPGEGKVVIVNAQKKYALADIDRAIDQFRKKLMVTIEVREGTWRLGDKLPADANIAVYLVDDAALPMSLVAMEARWGVMNVAPLEGAKRFDLELTRVATATLGAGVSQYKISPMQPINSPEDLDTLVGTGLTIDSGSSMKRNLEKLGVTPRKMMSYRKACEQGWAPQPTNDYQKAVWDEIHTPPSDPIKIKYDPKRDK